MCLAVPGKIVTINNQQDSILQTGKFSFGGVIKEVSFAYVPNAKLNDYAVINTGFAISILDTPEAKRTLEYLQKIQA